MAFHIAPDAFFHPKMLAAGNSALGLWVRCGAWSAQQETDGLILGDVARRLGSEAQACRLVAAGLWHARGHACPSCPQPASSDDYVMHDWRDYNATRGQALERREQEAAKKRRQRAARNPQAGGTEIHSPVSGIVPGQRPLSPGDRGGTSTGTRHGAGAVPNSHPVQGGSHAKAKEIHSPVSGEPAGQEVVSRGTPGGTSRARTRGSLSPTSNAPTSPRRDETSQRELATGGRADSASSSTDRTGPREPRVRHHARGTVPADWQPSPEDIAAAQQVRIAAGMPVLTGQELAYVTHKYVRDTRAKRRRGTPEEWAAGWQRWAETERPTTAYQPSLMFGLGSVPGDLRWPHEHEPQQPEFGAPAALPPMQTCPGCERPFRAPAPGTCRQCRDTPATATG